ncbi:hypothetical protein Tco_0781697, partial [Tanacetum coccineum]
CMTRSSTNELFTPFKEPECPEEEVTEIMAELISPNFNSFSNQEYPEEEVAEIMAETMKQYMSKT